jgi:hypothetical protein
MKVFKQFEVGLWVCGFLDEGEVGVWPHICTMRG